MKQNQKGFIDLILIVLLVILLLAGAFTLWKINQIDGPADEADSSTLERDFTETNDLELAEFTNDEYKFTFNYPAQWEVSTHPRTEKFTEKVIPGLEVSIFEEPPNEQGNSSAISISVRSIDEIDNQTVDFFLSQSVNEVLGPIEKNIEGAKGVQFIWQSDVNKEPYTSPDHLSTIFDTDAYRYWIIYDYPKGQTDYEYIDDYNAIVDSFKLL